MPQVAIIDGGGANIASLQFALQRLGAASVFTSDAELICSASHVILPGVGAAANAMHTLRQHQLSDLIGGLTQPVLGICLGMQLLGTASAENRTDCLGIVSGTAREMQRSPRTPVPNMGWCRVRKDLEHPLLAGVDDGCYFYFVHSYAMPIAAYTVASAQHNSRFTAVLAHNNFYATQFHPERSASAGARVLDNFLKL